MKLDSYIRDLLFEHDCVVIPGFGGFVANYAPARIHPTQHTFEPPSKNILFNKNLTNNDGLLANKIVGVEGCSYQQALINIQMGVDELNANLSESKKIAIEEVGVLYYDIEKNLQFTIANGVNYLVDSFGLPSFHSSAIKRENISQRIEKEFIDRGPIKQEIKKVNYKKVIPYVVLLPILFLMVWIPLKTDLLHQVNYSNLNPFAEKEQALYKESKSESLPELPKFTAKEFIEADDTLKYKPYYISDNTTTPITIKLFEAVADSTNTVAKSVLPVIQESSSTKQYYIIAGCFREAENANKLLEKLKFEGYAASIVDTTSGGLIRVCFSGHSTMNDALKSIGKIQASGTNAWLLSI